MRTNSASSWNRCRSCAAACSRLQETARRPCVRPRAALGRARAGEKEGPPKRLTTKRVRLRQTPRPKRSQNRKSRPGPTVPPLGPDQRGPRENLPAQPRARLRPPLPAPSPKKEALPHPEAARLRTQPEEAVRPRTLPPLVQDGKARATLPKTRAQGPAKPRPLLRDRRGVPGPPENRGEANPNKDCLATSRRDHSITKPR